MFDDRLQGHWSRQLDQVGLVLLRVAECTSDHITQFCSYLGETYKLSKEVEPRMYFGEKEYKKLFEAAIHNSRFFDHVSPSQLSFRCPTYSSNTHHSPACRCMAVLPVQLLKTWQPARDVYVSRFLHQMAGASP